WREGSKREGFSVPRFVPVLGMVSTFFLTFQIQVTALIPVGILTLISLALFAAARFMACTRAEKFL
ncbi:MAG TPA: hypothetical protein VJC08_04615, partial [bacterium]|nr:hypothetical protein [bacterium]